MVKQLGLEQSHSNQSNQLNMLSRASLVDLEAKLADNILTALDLSPETSPGQRVIKAVKSGIYEIPISPIKNSYLNRTNSRAALEPLSLQPASVSSKPNKQRRAAGKSLGVEKIMKSENAESITRYSKESSREPELFSSLRVGSRDSDIKDGPDHIADLIEPKFDAHNIQCVDVEANENSKQDRPKRNIKVEGQRMRKAISISTTKTAKSKVVCGYQQSGEIKQRSQIESQECIQSETSLNRKIPANQKPKVSRAKNYNNKPLTESNTAGMSKDVNNDSIKTRLRHRTPVNYKLPSLVTKMRRT